jgi:hypothetical protein
MKTVARLSDWSLLDDEIGRWREAGREAILWWRDDDAEEATPELERLLAVQRRTGMPLALAVVPSRATPALAERLEDTPAVNLLQHGYAHVNHALAADKKSELGNHRPAMLVLGELGTGWLAMERLFGECRTDGRVLNVLVPPWNRIAPELVPALPEIGFAGLSTFGLRPRGEPVRGLRQVNTHLDLIDWHDGGRFVGAAPALERLTAALAAARTIAPSRQPEPIGILSHHLVMDDGAWDFLTSLIEKVRKLQGVKTPAAHELFASREARF